jgi:hypothetical protein
MKEGDLMSVDRFAISALSKSNKSVALNEEIMINKNSGEILVKSTTGFIVSYDKLARENAHINKLTDLCYDRNFLGTMCKLEFDNYDLPEIVPETTNIVSAPVTVALNKIKKILISLDLDNLKILAGETSVDVDPIITIDFTLAINSTQVTTYAPSLSQSLDKNNIYIFEPSYPAIDPGDVVDYTALLNSITIVRDGNPADVLEFLLHSIYFVIEEV